MARQGGEREKPRLDVDIGRLPLNNPVLTASGTFGYGLEFTPWLELRRLGGIIVKGLSLHPQMGAPPPRIVETPAGMLNAIGLQNVGIDAFVREKLPPLLACGTPIIANIYGHEVEEYCEVAKRAEAAGGIAGLEVNISCPNVQEGGMVFGNDPQQTYMVIRAIRQATSLPLMVKLSPNVTDITLTARAAVEAGADALSLINTVVGMAIDIYRRRPRLANVTGGLSGPAIRPIGVRMVWEVARAVQVPVVGIGGIVTAEDALEYLIAGATAVQVGTANFIDPQAAINVLEGIEAYCQGQQVDDIHQVIGSLRL